MRGIFRRGETIIFFSSILLSIFVATSSAVDTISANQTVRDDRNITIVSAGGMFEMGFFSLGHSTNRYIGIWYKNIANRTIVWVANRGTPVRDNSGELRINANGSLVLTDGTDRTIWSSNSSSSTVNPVAQLLDSGNLVMKYSKDADPVIFLWQSFDHPTDNLLPGMKLGWNLVTGLNKYLTSWKSANDPSPGNYTTGVNRIGFPQLLVSRGTDVQFRFGPWDGVQFSGLSLSVIDLSFNAMPLINQKEITFSYNLINSSVAMRAVVKPSGETQFVRWSDATQTWEAYMIAQRDACDCYALCGAYGNCNSAQSQLGKSICGCLRGYQPKFPEKWKVADWSDGCVLKTPFGCDTGDTFVKYSGLKLPDTSRTWIDPNMNLEDCGSFCIKNCSCKAYSNIDIREGGIGCMMWIGDLIDIRNYRENGLDLYVRVSASEAEAAGSLGGKMRVRIITITLLVVLIMLLCPLMIHVFRKRMQRRKGIVLLHQERVRTTENEWNDFDLPIFDVLLIANATNFFSPKNKLGEGGFGSVYKGILDNGQEVAVKRLSKDSKQGLNEFKNEVSYIAKLQHRNLVRLLGCSIEEGEMLLIYEYMPNRSLDSLIFDKELSKSLDWPKRYNIINGIARGILYLHQDSVLRIIHRDLKASNILLDRDMNPKISDFGMARILGGSGRITNTTKVVGTFGYMSPEYALDGIYSLKSDVYSFGVLLLEIVSGRKMKGFYDPDPNLNLLGHAWRLYKEGNLVNLISSAIVESYDESEVLRTIQIGLLCVQPYPEDRPTMSFVVLMLSSNIELPKPTQPGFFTERKNRHSDSSSSQYSELSLSKTMPLQYIAPHS
ncbi:G-type lectin S-receptor-like serine/threonine-protein kinase At4g27290 [Apium graveolens]|uniref:G-type lectin S-receptor-like serine/threonine-protein kinase At4g27290 n=1 Tax=Apium graveolens TaxID=4045 RepID=UPI003D7B93CD